MFIKISFYILLWSISFPTCFAQEKVRLVIAGLAHGHVDWVFNKGIRSDIEIVGIYETNPDLIMRYAKRYNLDQNLFYNNLENMLDKVQPEAVSAFGATNEHIEIVRQCAPRKIHVMVEKPLATSLKDAEEIAALAAKNEIHVLTNFETSWYASNQYLKEMFDKGVMGELKKVWVNDGHQGPKEIGVSDEFFAILTDPVKNGAGALYDFGCYGAHLMTWLQNGEKPISVTAVTHQNKPGIYVHVDDEATIILQYKAAQAVIQASWNWPFSRKDMTIYGTKGYITAVDATTVSERLSDQDEARIFKRKPREAVYTDPFSYFAAVIKGKITPDKSDMYGLSLNVTVVELLEMAKQSATTGKTIYLE